MSRLDTGIVPASLETIDVALLVRQMADSDGLRTAIGNLVDNALKFTPSGGSVTLGVDADGSAYSGSGLGLATVRTTMEVYGGPARAESTPTGSRFELTLPQV